MNCCNEYGECKQGNGCPARCTPLNQLCGASEVPQPTHTGERQDEPLSTWEAIFLYGAIAISGISTLLVGAGTLGWLYFKHWS